MRFSNFLNGTLREWSKEYFKNSFAILALFFCIYKFSLLIKIEIKSTLKFIYITVQLILGFVLSSNSTKNKKFYHTFFTNKKIGKEKRELLRLEKSLQSITDDIKAALSIIPKFSEYKTSSLKLKKNYREKNLNQRLFTQGRLIKSPRKKSRISLRSAISLVIQNREELKLK